MKKIVPVLFLLLVIISCKKAEEEFPANPEWLTAKIAEMDTSKFYVGTTVYLYKWNLDYYYLISIPLSSCAMCDFYNYLGEKHIWTQNSIDDFQNNAKMAKIVWQRDLY